MRRQISAHPNVHFFDAAAVDARKDNGDIKVVLANGSIVAGSRLLLALGVSDILPDISGLSERWGKSVLHCPYCHGYEVSGQRLGVLNVSTISLQQALLVSDWGPTTFYTNGCDLDGPSLEQLQRRNVEIERDPVAGIVGEQHMLSAVQFTGGRLSPLGALFISPRVALNSKIADRSAAKFRTAPVGNSLRWMAA